MATQEPGFSMKAEHSKGRYISSKSSGVEPVVAIVGQTAAGKSAVALQLAQEFGGEIIAADSWTVRRELDIGTAKPSRREQEAVPHHLIDIVAPCEDFSAAAYKQLAMQKIAEIHTHHNMPMLAGGTGLYVDSVLFDYSFAPPGDPQARERYNEMSIDALLRLAAEKMLDTSSIDIRNKRRIIRLLETGGEIPQKQPLRSNTLILGIHVDKQELEERIEKRVDEMLARGLEQEVRSLVKTYGWECEGLKGIGYIEWREYISGTQSIEQVRERIIQATKQLAKRQQTWFKRNKHIHWCRSYKEARQEMCTFLQNQ